MSEQDDAVKPVVDDKYVEEIPVLEKYLMQEIEMPSDEKWKQEFDGFSFSADQKRELRETIKDINEGIIRFNEITKKAGPRSERRRKLLALEKSLRNTRYYVECFGDDMDDWLPFEVRAQIGLLSDFMTAEELLGDKTYSRRINQQLELAVFRKCALDIEKVDEKIRYSRESIGLQAGGKILTNFIQKIHEPLREWVELDRLNKGGAPANKTVRFIVYELARAAPDIVGAPAAIKKDGPFVELCSAVLRACGLSDASENVGNVVPQVVKKLRAGKL